MIDPDRIRRAYETARSDLLAERDPAGHWIGRLSGSALSTATAVSALSVWEKGVRNLLAAGPGGCFAKKVPDTLFPQSHTAPLQSLIAGGLQWLAQGQNDDGGWGDTDKSRSNVATTMLVRAAFHLAGAADRPVDMLQRAEAYLERQGGVPGLRARYGKDKTFAVPILTNCALAGLVPWREVSPLPFELACVPHAMYRFLRLPVVSYAIPALVAIGQARYFHRKPLNPIARLVRRLAVARSLAVVERMQPASGGFLEATPLTSFVVMSLAAVGRAAHPVVRRGVEFLVRSVRDDGSWPIDTNLATWVTTLAVNALAESGERVAWPACTDWLLSCQHLALHPFTNAAPGGWGWTDLSGAVPDADDTAGALLALAAIRASAGERDAARITSAAHAGIRWLLDLQNADGGWPTFCRGWGKLPFDRSGVDLTAHVIRAFHVWRKARDQLPFGAGAAMDGAIERGMLYLARQQRADGSWVPLWFGNQWHPAEENPVYGTARVLLAYRDLDRLGEEPAQRGLAWLAAGQNADGGWGGSGGGTEGGQPAGVSSVEETAVAAEALLSGVHDADLRQAAERGIAWLAAAVESGRHRESSPIGFYFARLWYYEKLYPLIFSVAALGQALCRVVPDPVG